MFELPSDPDTDGEAAGQPQSATGSTFRLCCLQLVSLQLAAADAALAGSETYTSYKPTTFAWKLAHQQYHALQIRPQMAFVFVM